MNNLDKHYQSLLQDILDNGVQKGDRTGIGTLSVFGRQIRHKMSEGFPLLTTKKMFFKGIVTELLWFLRGDTNIKYLVDNNCNIWVGDCYKKYYTYFNKLGEGIPLIQKEFINKIKTDDEFAEEWGDLGPIYGAQWRGWCAEKMIKTTLPDPLTGEDTYISKYIWIDQIQNLINDLKTNPDSRRLMVSAWNVGELDQMTLPPCHYGFQVYTRELSLNERLDLMRKRTKDGTVDYDNRHHVFLDFHNIPKRAISLMWNQRSVDTFLGLPFNIASYGLLLEIIANEVNMMPDELIGNLGDVHLYSNHIEQAKEQIGRELTWEEKIQWVMSNTDVELENLYITEAAASLKRGTREPFPLPKLKLGHFGNIIENIYVVDLSDFILENYQSHSSIHAPLSN